MSEKPAKKLGDSVRADIARIAALETYAVALKEKARALCDKLTEIHASHEYKSVWSIYWTRGLTYSGPTYNAEMDALRAAIADCGYEINPQSKCPTCGCLIPSHHPAVQEGGEVHLCEDPWHQPTAAEIRAREANSHQVNSQPSKCPGCGDALHCGSCGEPITSHAIGPQSGHVCFNRMHNARCCEVCGGDLYREDSQ